MAVGFMGFSGSHPPAHPSILSGCLPAAIVFPHHRRIQTFSWVLWFAAEVSHRLMFEHSIPSLSVVLSGEVVDALGGGASLEKAESLGTGLDV